MASIGNPLICDDRYGSADPVMVSDCKGETALVNRYALHACELTFTHPSGREMTLNAPLPQDMLDFLAVLNRR